MMMAVVIVLGMLVPVGRGWYNDKYLRTALPGARTQMNRRKDDDGSPNLPPQKWRGREVGSGWRRGDGPFLLKDVVVVLVCVPPPVLQGAIVTVELMNGEVYRGMLDEAEDNMNCVLRVRII